MAFQFISVDQCYDLSYKHDHQLGKSRLSHASGRVLFTSSQRGGAGLALADPSGQAKPGRGFASVRRAPVAQTCTRRRPPFGRYLSASFS